MTIKKIPKSIREIIDIFIRNSFNSLTYKMISEILNVETNAIVQRIKRNEDFFEVTGKRPYKISLKKNVKEIYFHRDKNQCQICRQMFKIETLLLRFKDPYMKDKYNWNNCFTCCQECKDKEIIKKNRRKRTKKVDSQKKNAWEYKEIYIKKIMNPSYLENAITKYLRVEIGSWDQPIEKRFSQSEEVSYDYYEFDELNGNGWFHIINDDNKISSKSIIDILNYFGEDEWDLVSIIKINARQPTALEYIPSYESYENNRENQYYCVFKRKKKGE